MGGRDNERGSEVSAEIKDRHLRHFLTNFPSNKEEEDKKNINFLVFLQECEKVWEDEKKEKASGLHTAGPVFEKVFAQAQFWNTDWKCACTVISSEPMKYSGKTSTIQVTF
ncbi:hypothetical protein E2C01_027655 [Portunus trituberculatus]|uniref:Uncharacterized protein n=1 Tax=Portunus trituberculatus TaxID=210409 RepID=A0A5B7EIP1_PORTR|nr:hypothetical protein [Portunus trituberculatus]